MDITDMFGEPVSTKSPAGTPPADPGVDLTALGYHVARVHDDHRAAVTAYNDRRAKLMEQVDASLDVFKTAADESAKKLDSLATELQKAMEKQHVTDIALSDRPAIKLKTIVGKKKSITLTWLEEFIPDQAAGIWKSVPRHPDKTELHIPDPHTP